MKNILRFVGKVLFFVSYPLLIIALATSGYFLYQSHKEVKDAKAEYVSIYENNSVMSGDPKSTIKEGFSDLGNRIDYLLNVIKEKDKDIASLTKEIESDKKQGYGELQGKVTQLVFADKESVNQYQRVCAESKSNANRQFCVAVSSIQGRYSLVLPEGEYYISAQIQGSEAGGKAYFTEFVKCSQTDADAECAAKLSEEKVAVKVESGKVSSNIDPVDWKLVAPVTPEKE